MTRELAGAAVVGGLAVAGLVLGRWRPGVGVSLLMAIVVPLSSLPWYLGLSNLPTTLPFAGGLLLGWWRRRSDVATHRDVVPRWLSWSAGALAFAVVWSGAIAFGRFALQAPDLVGAATLQTLSLSWRGVSGMGVSPITHLLAPLVGLGVALLLVVETPDGRTWRRRTLAWLLGVVIVLLAPLSQWLAKAPLVARPDQDLAIGSGWVAFFQDPHALAAYLVLAVGLLTGLALLRIGRAPTRVAVAIALCGCGGLLLMTGSRSGLLGGLTAAWTSAALAWWTVPATRRWRTVVGAVVLMIPLATVTIYGSAAARRGMASALTWAGAERLGSSLESPSTSDVAFSMRARQVHASRAWETAARYPVSGAGPGGLARSWSPLVERPYVEVPSSWLTENAHNYVLQVAAEFGWPATALFVAVWTGVLAVVVARVGGRRGRPTPEMGWRVGTVGAWVGFTLVLMTSHPLLLPELQAAVATLGALALTAPPARAERGGPDVPGRLPVMAVAAAWILASAFELRYTSVARPDAPWSWGVHAWEDTWVRPTPHVDRYRWTADAARFGWQPEARLITIPLYVERPHIPADGVRVRVRVDGVAVDDIRLDDSPSHLTLTYDRTAVAALAGRPGASGPVTVAVDVATPFRPRDETGSTDARVLGVKLGRLTSVAGLAGQDVGVYRWEVERETGRRFRWTRQLASMAVDLGPRGWSFDVRAGHPDISETHPVVVSAVWDGTVVARASLTTRAWHVIALPQQPQSRADGILTLHVDRVWSPAETYGRDRRVLAVAMTDLR